MSNSIQRYIFLALLLGYWNCGSAEQDSELKLANQKLSLHGYAPICSAITFGSPAQVRWTENPTSSFMHDLRDTAEQDPFLIWSEVLDNLPADEHVEVLKLASQWGRSQSLSKPANVFLGSYLNSHRGDEITDRQRIALQLEMASTIVVNGARMNYRGAEKAERYVSEAFRVFKSVVEQNEHRANDGDQWIHLGDWLIFSGNHRKAAIAYQRAWEAYEYFGLDAQQIFSEPVKICDDVRVGADLVGDRNRSKGDMTMSFSASIDTRGEARSIKVLNNPYGNLPMSAILQAVRFIHFRPALTAGKPKAYPSHEFSHIVYRGSN